jgi:hypothetical protein
MESPNTVSLTRQWLELGSGRQTARRAFRTFNAGAEPFRAAGDRHG